MLVDQREETVEREQADGATGVVRIGQEVVQATRVLHAGQDALVQDAQDILVHGRGQWEAQEGEPGFTE